MKKLLFILMSAALPLLADPHLMLYFDINKTLIASDRVKGKSEEAILNDLLAEKYADKGDAQEAQKIYTAALEKLHQQKGHVFTSFYRLLQALDEKEISYTIVLRSFGEEVFDVAEEINTLYGKKFQHTGQFKKGTLVLDTGERAETASEIEALLHESLHTAIRDDWNYWKEGEKKSRFGKPFPVSHSDVALFFDDNIDLEDDEANIIKPIDVETGELVAMEKLAGQHQIVAVDTLEAILDDNYFIEYVKTVCNNL